MTFQGPTPYSQMEKSNNSETTEYDFPRFPNTDMTDSL